jgi:hypothetical protein
MVVVYSDVVGGIPINEGGCDRLSGVLGRIYTLIDHLQSSGIYG